VEPQQEAGSDIQYQVETFTNVVCTINGQDFPIVLGDTNSAAYMEDVDPATGTGSFVFALFSAFFDSGPGNLDCSGTASIVASRQESNRVLQIANNDNNINDERELLDSSVASETDFSIRLAITNESSAASSKITVSALIVSLMAMVVPS